MLLKRGNGSSALEKPIVLELRSLSWPEIDQTMAANVSRRLDRIYCPPVARCRTDPLLRHQGAELEKSFQEVLFGMLSRAYEPLGARC